MSKGEEEQTRKSREGKQRKLDFHQCQRGRLLEILSLMAKDVAKIETGKESSIATRCREGRAAETGSFKEEAAKGE